MGDDIDDLLDEVERKYCSTPPTNATIPSKKASFSSSSKDSALLSEIDDLINDVGTDSLGVSQVQSKSRDTGRWSKTDRTSVEAQKRCTPLLLGGSNTLLGHSSYATQRVVGSVCVAVLITATSIVVSCAQINQIPYKSSLSAAI
ncbi:hypothetical protein EMCRGX_G030955 [Ephydatia muelleri]